MSAWPVHLRGVAKIVKFLRVAAMALVLLVATAAALAALAYQNQARVVKVVLKRIEQRTGLHLVVSGVSVHFRSHLAVVFEQPKIFKDRSELASLKEIRADVSYHALIYGAGLPLYALRLEKPELRLPASANPPAVIIPRLNDNLRARLTQVFANLSDVTRRLIIEDGSITAGIPLISGLRLYAYHRGLRSDRWLIHARAEWMAPPLTGLRVRGNFVFGQDPRVPDVILHGRLRASRIPLSGIRLAGVKLEGDGEARLAFALHYDGGVSGEAAVSSRGLAFSGSTLRNPLMLGDYAAEFTFEVGEKNAVISDFTLSQSQTRLFAGSIEVQAPYSADPVVGVRFSQVNINLGLIEKLLSDLRSLPPAAAPIIRGIPAGRINLDKVVFESSINALKNDPAAVLQANLLLAGMIANTEIMLPPGSHLPLISGVSAQVAYAHGLLVIAKGSATIGDSKIDDVTGRVNLSSDLKRIQYVLSARGDFAAGQLYQIAVNYEPTLREPISKRVWKLEGRAAVNATVSGELLNLRAGSPADFLLRLMPKGLLLSFRSPSTTLIFTGGDIVLRPGSLQVEQVKARTPGGPRTPDQYGHVIASGELSRAPSGIGLHNLTLSLHRVSASRWIPMALDIGQMSVRGKIDGRLLINGDYGGAIDKLRINGRLTLGAGEMKFAFLRAPLLIKAAALTFDGRGLRLSLQQAEFEGAPMTMSLSIGDLAHPSMELDASAQRLDLLALNFIRLPWTPPSPVTIFSIPVHGHLAARVATIAMMQISDANADYSYDGGKWYVRDFKGGTLGGRISLNLSGGPDDNGIHIIGRVDKVDAGQFLMLLEHNDQPRLTGVLTMDGDLRANMDTSFFQTLSGKLAIEATNGRLNRFTLLSRILGLIDLKGWLTASVPDPRLHGLPFDSLTADFNGSNGVFYTDDLRLTGPVMDMLAEGVFRTPDATLDMQIGMVPFNTVSWLIGKIPLIGNNLSQASGQILAAYFQVSGPVANPRVTPKPITSVAEFVKKILSLPINTIRPNTVR